jgi:hypothetical protein
VRGGVPRGPGGGGGVQGAAEGCTRGKRAVAAEGESSRSRVLASLAPGDGLSAGWVVWRVVWHVANHTEDSVYWIAEFGEAAPVTSKQDPIGRQAGRAGGFEGRRSGCVAGSGEVMSLSVIVPVTNSGAPRWSVWAMQAGNAS